MILIRAEPWLEDQKLAGMVLFLKIGGGSREVK